MRQEFEILYAGAKYGGKSACSRIWLIKGNQGAPDFREYDDRGKLIPVNLNYTAHPEFIGAVIRLNEKDLAEWVDRALPFYEGILGGTFTKNPAEFRWPSGARVFLGHCGDSNCWTKFQGINITRFSIEEAAQIPNMETFDFIRSCCRSVDPKNMKAQILLTANPGGPGTGWLMDRYIEPRDRKGNPIMHPVHKRPIVAEDGGLITLTETVTNPFTGKEITTDRVWVPSYLTDNPKAMEDDAYIATLATMSNEKMRRAYLLGDWKAMQGNYFDNFNANTHTYDPKTRPLASWMKATGSLDWGFVHESAMLKHRLDAETGQHLVYEEFTTERTDPIELGAEMARRWMPELRVQGNVIIYVSHDLYREVMGEFYMIELIQKGVQRVLGKTACYVPDAVCRRLREQRERDGGTWTEDDEARIQSREVEGITFRRAPKATAVVWMHLRTLMRTESLAQIVKAGMPDFAMAARIAEESTMEAYTSYLKTFEASREILPELLISRDCPRLIDAIPKMQHSPDSPENVDDKHFRGRDVIDSLAYLCAGIRDEKPAPLPRRLQQEQALEHARRRNPSLTFQEICWIAQGIEEIQSKENEPEEGFSLPRSARALRFPQ